MWTYNWSKSGVSIYIALTFLPGENPSYGFSISAFQGVVSRSFDTNAKVTWAYVMTVQAT